MSADFHIGISYQEDLPTEFIKELTDTISAPDLQIRAEPREIGLYATIEWAIPTLVIAYLSKPYFEAFLQEAGKDHYQVLKKGLLILLKKLFGTKTEQRDKKHSILFSVMAQLQDGRSIKFVFPEGISLEQYETALEQIYSLLSEHYNGHPDDPINKMAARLIRPSSSLYLEFKVEETNWELIDPIIEAQKARKAQNKD